MHVKAFAATLSQQQLLYNVSMEHSKKTFFSRAELLDHLRPDSFERVERTIDVHIRNLRAKIEPRPDRPAYILTVFGVGYRFGDTDG